MADTFTPRLRPNTFITLLIRSARRDFGSNPRTPATGYSGKKLTRAALLSDLMHVVDASSMKPQDTLTSYMAKFMNGSLTHSDTYFPFKDVGFQCRVAERMNSDYLDALHEMDALCRKYLSIEDQSSMRILVGGIIETLLQDNSFTKSLSIAGKSVTKGAIASLGEIPLQSFLLEIWRQIVMEHHDSSEASETYMRWTSPGSPRRIITRIGEEMSKKIAVTTTLPEEQPMDTVEDDATVIPNDEEPVIVIPEGHSSQRKGEYSRQKEQQRENAYNQTFINNGLFINHQVADSVTNIPHVENLVINLGK